MCGILGGNNSYWDYENALHKLYHRGPNCQEMQKIDNFYMGFARLAIIDLSEKAMQPMHSFDKRFSIVFNGEIYDYEIIRKELEKKGYCFQTKSDTEVLLYSFIEWKERMMEHIDGIFAFAIMDKQNKQLYLFRDRCGVKPLYYYYDGRNFAFSSELKGIKALCNNVSFDVDETALYDYHMYLYIPDPKTMYKNVYKLEPASYIIFDYNRNQLSKSKKYWKVKLNTREGNVLNKKQLDAKAEELRYHLERCVKRQIVSDVPVGTFLSGGVDSSIITAVTKQYLEDVTAYCIGFHDSRYDESKYAKEIADIINVDCKIRKFSINEFLYLYQELPDWYDEPYADTSAYPTYYVSKFAREDVTVVLTGDGGDELFGGYPRCIFAKENLIKRRINNRKLSELFLDNSSKLNALGEEMGNFCKEDVAQILPRYLYRIKPNRSYLRAKYHIPKEYDDFWYIRRYYHKDLPPYTRMRYLDFMTYMNGDILTKVDRVSMRTSLEARVPFLDREMVDFAFSLTQEECNPKGELKGLLKYAYQNTIPRKLFDRQKQGFSIPFSYIRKEKCPQEFLIEELWNL